MDTSQLKWWVFDISDWDWGVSLCVVGKTRGVGKARGGKDILGRQIKWEQYKSDATQSVKGHMRPIHLWLSYIAFGHSVHTVWVSASQYGLSPKHIFIFIFLILLPNYVINTMPRLSPMNKIHLYSNLLVKRSS